MTPVDRLSADICIIGAGSGGLSVAAGAAQLGRKVVLCEKGEMGGDCLNYGCVPSKSLIAAAASARNLETARQFGVSTQRADVDFKAVMDHVHSVIGAIAPHDSQERFENLGVTVLRDAATFTGKREIRVGSKTVVAKHYVIATGSSPALPPIPGLGDVRYLTNETIFQIREKPQHLVIIGGGPIGIELAQAFRRLGSDVTIIEAAQILSREDSEAVAIIREALASEGVNLFENANIERIDHADGGISVRLAEQTISGSHLLVAAGRRANVDNLDLEKAGVAYDDRGISVDARLRTTNKRIYAIGDVAGGAQFTHVAGDHAGTVIRNILFKLPARRRDVLAPRVTYCDPEIAAVGAPTHAPAARTATWRFADNDRARTEREASGFVKLSIKSNGAVAGATIVGAHAGELISVLCLAITAGLKARALVDMIPPYPTRSEAVKRAAGALYGPQLFSERTRRLVKLLATFD